LGIEKKKKKKDGPSRYAGTEDSENRLSEKQQKKKCRGTPSA